MSITNPDLPNWVAAVGKALAGIAAIGTAILAFVKGRKKLQDTKIYEALNKDHLMNSILMNIKLEIPEVDIVSVLAFTNHAKPVNFQVLYSSDTDTQTLWRDRIPMESGLITLTYEMIQKGDIRFFPSELHNKTTIAWYDANDLKKTYMFTIGIGQYQLNGDDRSEQALLALAINSKQEKVPSSDSYLKLHKYVNEVRAVAKLMSTNNKLIV